MERLVRFDGENGAVIVNNADWLRNLNFMDFMRDIAVHFSVNEMLRAECYKQRFERGLTFFEFSYMLMQSYDFLCLNRKYGCELEWAATISGAISSAVRILSAARNASVHTLLRPAF